MGHSGFCRKIGAVAYKLSLPPNSKIHPVFHVSCLKKAVGQNESSQPLPKGLETDLSTDFEPESVVAERYKQRGGEQVQQVLIHWKDRSVDEDTWEDVTTFINQFPGFSLEDKAVSKEAGIVRSESRTKNILGHKETRGPVGQEQRNKPTVNMVYTRRRKRAGGEQGVRI
ncbi:hypothetical protein F511_39990 [Dorcoceras hygrometricum]|uniref:Uncharacterized protein n=1 Tax=Dorcoceras hygrometricum TaxID=472368 RepID=A0A2Z7A2X1_9LAMI|nr:hypothetical protein F511_39990 [Dorcoceras hygrometricum]